MNTDVNLPCRYCKLLGALLWITFIDGRRRRSVLWRIKKEEKKCCCAGCCDEGWRRSVLWWLKRRKSVWIKKEEKECRCVGCCDEGEGEVFCDDCDEEVGGEVSRPVSSRDQNEKHCDTTQQQQKQLKAEFCGTDQRIAMSWCWSAGCNVVVILTSGLRYCGVDQRVVVLWYWPAHCDAAVLACGLRCCDAD